MLECLYTKWGRHTFRALAGREFQSLRATGSSPLALDRVITRSIYGLTTGNPMERPDEPISRPGSIIRETASALVMTPTSIGKYPSAFHKTSLFGPTVEGNYAS